nr:oxalurate catabolism protein HpxZ [Mesorhizobium sp. BR1-1-16]
MTIEIDHPETKAELEEAFARYEAALVANDVAVLDELFLVSPATIRYGATENLYGYNEIAAFRSGRSPAGLARRLARTVITTYGRDCGVASTLFYRDSAPGKVGRQTQTWVRTVAGWRVAAAHVSLIADPDGGGTGS